MDARRVTSVLFFRSIWARFSRYNGLNAPDFRGKKCCRKRCKERPPAQRGLCRRKILCHVCKPHLLRVLAPNHRPDVRPFYGAWAPLPWCASTTRISLPTTSASSLNPFSLWSASTSRCILSSKPVALSSENSFCWSICLKLGILAHSPIYTPLGVTWRMEIRVLTTYFYVPLSAKPELRALAARTEYHNRQIA